MLKMRSSALVCVPLVWVLLATPAFAQDPTGAIEGAVTDTSAAAVARIVATHLETGRSKEATAGSDGFYRVPLLPVGATA